MGPVALDANVLIGFLDSTDALHARAVDTLGSLLEAGAEVVVPASAYAEVLVHAFREGDEDHVEGLVDHAPLTVVAVDRPAARLAASLRASHRWLTLADALVLAVAQSRRAELVTFDEQLGRLATSSPR